MTSLTKRQEDVLDYVKSYIASHGYPPTVREIGKALGVEMISNAKSGHTGIVLSAAPIIYTPNDLILLIIFSSILTPRYFHFIVYIIPIKLKNKKVFFIFCQYKETDCFLYFLLDILVGVKFLCR